MSEKLLEVAKNILKSKFNMLMVTVVILGVIYIPTANSVHIGPIEIGDREHLNTVNTGYWSLVQDTETEVSRSNTFLRDIFIEKFAEFDNCPEHLAIYKLLIDKSLESEVREITLNSVIRNHVPTDRKSDEYYAHFHRIAILSLKTSMSGISTEWQSVLPFVDRRAFIETLDSATMSVAIKIKVNSLINIDNRKEEIISNIIASNKTFTPDMIKLSWSFRK